MPRRQFSLQYALRLTLGVAAVVAAWSAHAQQAPAEAPPQAPPPAPAKAAPLPAPAPAMQKVEIKGASAGYDPRRDDTASKTIVNSEEILRYGDTSVLDVFKRLPGITVNGASGRGGGEVRMRGLGGGYTQILLNGERAPAGFSIDSLSPDVIERIEILRAASAEFSTQSIAGTINIVLKKAIKNTQRELKLTRADGGTYRTSSANLQLSDRAGAFSYSLAGSTFRNDYEYESPVRERGVDAQGAPNLLRQEQGIGDGRNQGFNLSPRLNWALADGDTLTSQSFIYAGNSRGASRTVVATVLGSAPLYPQQQQQRSGHNAYARSDLNWVHKLAAGAKLELKIGANRSRNTSDLRDVGMRGDGSVALDSDVSSVSTENGYSSTGKYSTPLVEGHALSAGWDAGTSQRDDARRERGLAGNRPVNSDEGFTAKVGRLALYGQDEWNITPRWSVYAGVRWEGLDTRSEGNVYDAVHQTSSVWSPLLQTLWKLPNSSKDQLRLALTRTYKAPSTSSLIPRRFTSTNNSQTEPDRRGNPNLKPELALGLDASFEHYLGEAGGGGLLSVSASMRRIDGYTRQGLLLENGRWLSIPVNDGRALTRGIELEAKFPLRRVLAGAPAIDLRASVSRNWSRVEAVPGPDNRLDQQTPLSANMGIDYKAAGGALSAGASFVFRNGGPVRINLQQRASTPVRRELDVYALWKFTPQYQLRVAVANLLAQPERAETSYSDAGGASVRSWSSPGHLLARATLEMKF